MKKREWTDAEVWALQRAYELYDHQHLLILECEPLWRHRSASSVRNRTEQLIGWAAPEGTERLALRIETEPAEVAREIEALLSPSRRRQMPVALAPYRSARVDPPDPVVQSVPAESSEEPACQDDCARLSFLRAQVRQLEQRNRELVDAVGRGAEYASAVIEAVRAEEPYPAWRHEHAAVSETPVSAVLMFSDWHIGERIRAEETENFNAFDWAIAQSRLFGVVDAFVDWVGVQRHAYRIDHCAVFGVGDYISGDIHRELSVTAEFPVPVQAAKAGWLLGEALRRLGSAFDAVTFWACGADNHGRLTPKPQAKQKAANSYSYLVHTIAAAAVERCGNVVIHAAEGAKLLAEVSGWRFLLEHGDAMRGWMGIPYYGIERVRGREALRRMNTQQTFDYIAIGHWHTPSLLGGAVVMNGSLSGTSEYDHVAGRHGPPAQVAFLVHPRRGLFNLVSFRGE